jgi:putative tryptophan/tyrosine transport system substrate-binding protein
MKRRRFIAVLGGAAAWPLAGHAEQPERMRRVSVLAALPDDISEAMVRAFVRSLEGLGWVEGKNIRIDRRFAAGDPTLLETSAAELFGLVPEAILAISAAAVTALRRRTRTIPIVFLAVPEPVELGFVQSLARPGGKITGFTSFDAALMGKWLQLLKEVAPRVTRVGVLFNPDIAPSAPLYNRAIEAAAPSFGMKP